MSHAIKSIPLCTLDSLDPLLPKPTRNRALSLIERVPSRRCFTNGVRLIELIQLSRGAWVAKRRGESIGATKCIGSVWRNPENLKYMRMAQKL